MKGWQRRSVNNPTRSADKYIGGPVSRESIPQKASARRLADATPETLSRLLYLVAAHHNMIPSTRSMEMHVQSESDVAQGGGLSPESHRTLDPTSHARSKSRL